MNLRSIAITGPESTGKSALAKKLASHFKTLWVPEYARDYLTTLERPYTFEDIGIIAKKQFELEKEISKKARDFLFCDTDFIVLKVWSMFKYGKCDAWIEEMAEYHRYDMYLLCNTDLPWENDPLREHPDQREELLRIYMKELKAIQASYILVSGKGKARTDRAILAVNKAFEDIRF